MHTIEDLPEIIHIPSREIQDAQRQRVARALTRWVDGRRQDPLPDWNSLPAKVQEAYLEQADDAIAAMYGLPID